MKLISKYIVSVGLICLLMTCSEEEVTKRNYPRIRTLSVTEITSEGAKFSAEITFRGDFEVINYGFVWSETQNPLVESNERVVYTDNILNDNFSKVIRTTLEEGTDYFVRAFIETPDFLVYGENVSFQSLGSSAPEIESIAPTQGTLGDTVEIIGRDFSYVRNNNKVLFSGIEANVITSTDTTITCLVPDLLRLTNSKISVEINGNITTFSDSFELLPPSIKSISKDFGKTYDTLQIIGEYFGKSEAHPIILFESRRAEIVDFKIDTLEVVVPGGLSESSHVKVRVAHQNDETPFQYLKPKLIDFEPKTITWGDTIKVSVKNFYQETNFQQLLLNGMRFDLLETYEDSVFFVVPEDLIVNKETASIYFEIANFLLQFENEALFKKPKILSTSSDTVEFEDLVTLNVQNFHPTKNEIIIKYQSNIRKESRRLNLESNGQEKLEFIFPTLNDLRNLKNSDNLIVMEVGVVGTPFRIIDTLVVKSPIINSFSPQTVSNIGEQVIIRGKGFGNSPVVEHNQKELSIISSAD
ncbi:MAG: IPT/TIG domain-containing protein, partial [Bacteroidota bacterium]